MEQVSVPLLTMHNIEVKQIRQKKKHGTMFFKEKCTRIYFILQEQMARPELQEVDFMESSGDIMMQSSLLRILMSFVFKFSAEEPST